MDTIWHLEGLKTTNVSVVVCDSPSSGRTPPLKIFLHIISSNKAKKTQFDMWRFFKARNVYDIASPTLEGGRPLIFISKCFIMKIISTNFGPGEGEISWNFSRTTFRFLRSISTTIPSRFFFDIPLC